MDLKDHLVPAPHPVPWTGMAPTTTGCNEPGHATSLWRSNVVSVRW